MSTINADSKLLRFFDVPRLGAAQSSAHERVACSPADEMPTRARAGVLCLFPFNALCFQWSVVRSECPPDGYEIAH